MSKYLISIVVIIYNVEKYLHECIHSVISQNADDIEIILVNDASTDSCGRICEEYEKKDKRIKAIHNQNNMGASGARNIGLEHASGEWITFVDGDDILSKQAVTVMKKYQSVDAELIIFDYQDYRNNQIIEKPSFFHENFMISSEQELKRYRMAILGLRHSIKDFLDGVPICSPWAKMYKVDFLMRNRLLFNTKIKRAQDVTFAFLTAHYLTKVYIVPECIYLYRYNEAAISYRFSSDILDKQTSFIEELYRILEVFNEVHEKMFIEAIQVRSLYELEFCFKLGLFHEKCAWNKRERMNWFNRLCNCKWITDISPNLIRNEYKGYFIIDILTAIKNKDVNRLNRIYYTYRVKKKIKQILRIKRNMG